MNIYSSDGAVEGEVKNIRILGVVCLLIWFLPFIVYICVWFWNTR